MSQIIVLASIWLINDRAAKTIEALKSNGSITVPNALRWRDISSQSAYQSELEKMNVLYRQNNAFRELVRSETAQVIQDRLKPGQALAVGIEQGTPYVLEELAWITSAPEILGAQKTWLRVSQAMVP